MSDQIDDAIDGFIARRLQDEKAAQSGAPSLSPEGQDALTNLRTDIALALGMTEGGEDDDSDEGLVRAIYDLRWSITTCSGSCRDAYGNPGPYPQPQAQARTPSAASAASAPEGHVCTFYYREDRSRACHCGKTIPAAAKPDGATMGEDAGCDPKFGVPTDHRYFMTDKLAAAIARARDLHEALCKVALLAPESRTIDAAERIAKAALEADRAAVQSAPHRPDGIDEVRALWADLHPLINAVVQAMMDDPRLTAKGTDIYEPVGGERALVELADEFGKALAAESAVAADVVEIHAETILRVVDYCRSDGPRSVLADCEAVLAFVAKANA